MIASSPLISILTPSYNQGRYIEQNIRSVAEQKYARIEHIVIDGGSTDETVSVLKKYPHVKWVSEPDRGQADALNKGLNRATGDLIGWVNSDDFYADNVFTQVAARFEDRRVQWSVGDVLNYNGESGAARYVRSPTITYDSLIRNPDNVRQQGAFFRASTLRSAGGWDPDLYMVMDLDLWLRLARVSPPQMVHEQIAYFRFHAAQKSQLSRCMLQTREIDRVLQRCGASSATRLRYRAKKQYWWLKGMAKMGLIQAGLVHNELI
jgi:glycosyltransferase involved in cell wall biosynthesis